MSATNSTNMYLPNQYTEMAWMPPDLAVRVTTQLYATVGSLTIFLWDAILHASQDYKLLTRFRINISFILYGISRLTTLAYILGLVVVQITPIGNCRYIRDISILYPLTMPLTTLLLVMRVCALCGNNKFIILFFTVSWLSVLASFIIVPIGVTGMQIGNTKYCFEMKSDTATMASVVSALVLDTLIFVVTSFAFMRISYEDVPIKRGYKAALFGQHLSAFSRSILRGGQAYFLATLILHLAYAILYFVPTTFITPCAVGPPTLVLINNMSSHIYRNMRFGFYRDYTIRSSAINVPVEKSEDSQNPRNLEAVDLESDREERSHY